MFVVSKLRILPKSDIYIMGISILFLLVACLAIFFIVKDCYYPSSPRNLVIQSAQDAKSQHQIRYSTRHPSSLNIPSLDITVEIRDGYFDANTNTWTLGDDFAYFATSTATPNEKEGKTFLYGHARQNIFLNLFNIREGDNAYITTRDGKKYTYSFADSYTTNPTDLGSMKPTKKPTLTIQTCSGFRFQNRTMFNFKLETSNKLTP